MKSHEILKQPHWQKPQIIQNIVGCRSKNFKLFLKRVKTDAVLNVRQRKAIKLFMLKEIFFTFHFENLKATSKTIN